jgi:hypothetical protein
MTSYHDQVRVNCIQPAMIIGDTTGLLASRYRHLRSSIYANLMDLYEPYDHLPR